jgi:hypothetical protein
MINKDLVIELSNFIEDLTLGSSDLSDDYIVYKAKRFVGMLKVAKKFVEQEEI